MDFEAVIGLEIHVQISTKTKMFCRCDNDSFEKEPNINTCPVCMGFPGQLPVVNKIAVSKGIVSALALNCEILESCKFDRKNYFYPDNPKGFQISQFDEPLSKNGSIEVEFIDSKTNEKKIKKIGITRLHLEDDAGKLTHVRDSSLVDFNRAGTPLMEIVSEPDMRNSDEAHAYACEIQKIMRYIGSSEADMEKGMMRFDASVSIRKKGETKLNPRAEIKNLNSFKALKNAIDYEISRQIELYKNTGIYLKGPQTVGWDDDKGETFFMRDKEESDDYRYFPEPDVPPLHVDKKMVADFKKSLPELPNVKKNRYINELSLNEDDANLLSSDLKLAQYFEEVCVISKDNKKAISFITTILMKYLNEDLLSVDQQKVSAKMMGELINLVNEGVISNNIAKGEIFEEMYKNGKNPKDIVKEKGLEQISDQGSIEEVCKKVMQANPQSVADIKAGKDKAIGFLVGQVIKEMKGKANPQIVNELIKKLL
ncbi:MAG: Asp-tRNA(Asn)/Glu-tRNA(Gln) amidotransferase subunit GatB [Candidatus Gracilibacteria bacterium]|jgi:aspartyl-tRNA(Asn)/glutamyl-tRNA(Gln) amidotransferase subunit B